MTLAAIPIRLGVLSTAYRDELTDAAGALPISGTVHRYSTPANIPVSRRVYLLQETDLRRVRATVSNAETGAYSFHAVPPGVLYTILAYDDTGTYRAAVANGIQAGAVAP